MNFLYQHYSRLLFITLEEENATFKEKLSIFKDKLKESTAVIENLTDQLFTLNGEYSQLKNALGNLEEKNANYKVDIEILNKKLQDTSKRNVVPEDLKIKIQQLKDTIKEQKNEIKLLSTKNYNQEKEIAILRNNFSSNQHKHHEIKIKELHDKLEEASRQMLESAEIISLLKKENINLRKDIQTPRRSEHESKADNEKSNEKNIVKSLQKQIMKLNCALHGAEEMVALREKELTEIAAHLQLLQTDDGIRSLLNGLKNKKQQMKVKDEGIKSLVEEINNLNELLNDLQIENATMRQHLNISVDEKVNTTGFLKEYYDTKQELENLNQKLSEQENKLLTMEVENRIKDKKISKFINFFKNIDYPKEKIDIILSDNDNNMEDLSPIIPNREKPDTNISTTPQQSADYQKILEENEGLRSSLSEILDCLKDNSTTTSGVLTLECPSLDSVLQTMEARKASGWFAPHMKTVLELRTALGGRDALLTALHESRKETFEVMHQLSKASEKAIELEKELKELKSSVEVEKYNSLNVSDGEFGPWMSDSEYQNLNLLDSYQLQNIIAKGDTIYENQIKYCLVYFQNKFKALYDKLTDLAINVSDDKNNWVKQEEIYKMEIEKLKAQIGDEDISEPSPGLVEDSNNLAINLKCNFLQENYKYIRSLNENLRNECLESKKELLSTALEYERKVQNLMAIVINLTDKLRNSLPNDLFWRQNSILNDCNLKYRSLLENNACRHLQNVDLLTELNKNKADIIKSFQDHFEDGPSQNSSNRLIEFENSITQKQVVFLSSELDGKTKEIQQLKSTIEVLVKAQNEFINKLSSTPTSEEIEFMKDNMKTLADENMALKEHCHHLNSDLERVTTQFQALSHKELTADVEIDLLRHQILDLQSTGQKAVVSRLSSELLISHLQATENSQKVESLKLSLNKEKQLRFDAEEMLYKQQKKFDIYVTRNNVKFRNMFEIIEVLRNQYQGVIPSISIENYLKSAEEIYQKNIETDAKLNDIEDIRNSLMTKHAVFDQILNLSKCDQEACPHKIKCLMLEKTRTMELDHSNNKMAALEQSHNFLLQRYKKLEQTLLLINQGFKPKAFDKTINILCSNEGSVALEDMQSDTDSNSKENETYTLSPKSDKEPEPQIREEQQIREENLVETKPVYTQTISNTENRGIQADDQSIADLKNQIATLKNDKKKQDQRLNDVLLTNKKQTQEISELKINKDELNKDHVELERKIKKLQESYKHKDMLYNTLQTTAESLKMQLSALKSNEATRIQSKNLSAEENKSLLLTMRKVENDKNSIIEEYKKLLQNERDEFAKSVHEFQTKISNLQAELDNGKGNNIAIDEKVKTPEKLYTKVIELEDKCFKLNTDLETCKSELKTCNCELERWKKLASERLTKMEQLSDQLKERHNQEVESYKAENEHWLVQLNETQRDHAELRTKLSEQKALHLKQLAEKDAHIEHLRSVINNLKTQIMNMQTMISINDPSFDLSAIVEVEEVSDAMSHQDSDKLELRFGSAGDLNDLQDDLRKFPSSSTAIWQEPLIERLRSEKQQISKQNAILRKQIKALAGRERRARLDAQNLKNQVFRISTSGNKVSSVESAALQNKIASLQAQLTSARRDAHSSVALWDKWKRAQQSSERWQARYEEKCQEVIKIESSLNLARSAIQRLEKEKRVLLSRISESKNIKSQAIEKYDAEPSEKSVRREYIDSPLSSKALLERIEAQQRRIVALEFAEKGNEPLVSEYEKSLAEIASLKGQVLKLESALLEAQIKSPLKASHDNQPELEYWKSYCEMLKEENMQLTLRVSTLESGPTSSQRVNDLEQTVLTLRGLVSKLQVEQKCSSNTIKRIDSRPTSGRSSMDKNRNSSAEMFRTEISNLKRTIHDKDLLLEKSKEMLKMAAEREEDLLRENMMLRRRLEQVTDNNGGFFSV